MVQQVHEYLWVVMRQSQALQEDGADWGCMATLHFQVESKVCLDACNLRTTRPTWKLDWKCLGPFWLCSRVPPYAYEFQGCQSAQFCSVKSQLHRYESTGYNPSCFWIWWWKIVWRDDALIFFYGWRLMEKRSIKYLGLSILEYIGISYSIWYGGLNMIHLLGNLWSSWRAYKRWGSSTNDLLRRQDHKRMFTEGFEPSRGILSQFEGVQRYFQIMVGIRRWCGRNCGTERQRGWEMWRIRWDCVGATWYDKELVWGVATSGDVVWLYYEVVMLVVYGIMG